MTTSVNHVRRGVILSREGGGACRAPGRGLASTYRLGMVFMDCTIPTGSPVIQYS